MIPGKTKLYDLRSPSNLKLTGRAPNVGRDGDNSLLRFEAFKAS